MSNRTIYLRMLGYTATILMHVGNMIMMNFNLKKEVELDPELRNFSKLQPRYFTCWTFALQIVHAFLGLICDYLILWNSNNKLYKLPKYLKGCKNTLFSAILWPSTWVVFSVFWSLYLYDRRLIFPHFVDKVLTTTSNHIMHTAIVLVVLWEVFHQPRVEPKSHKQNLLHLTFHLLLYFAVLTYTYIERSIWIYPIFSIVYGTLYFPLIHITIGLLAFSAYYIQWTLSNYLWSCEMQIKKIS